jgi:hypothetical protein
MKKNIGGSKMSDFLKINLECKCPKCNSTTQYYLRGSQRGPHPQIMCSMLGCDFMEYLPSQDELAAMTTAYKKDDKHE